MPGGAVRLERAGLQRVGDRNPGEAEPLAQFTADDLGGEPGRKPGVQRRVDRPRHHHQLDPAPDSGLVGVLVGTAQHPQRHGQCHRLLVGVLGDGGRTQPGEVLRRRRDPGRLLCLDEVGAQVGDLVRVRGVGAPVLVVEVARRPVHIEHRRQVHVQADAGQVLARPPARGLRCRGGVRRLTDLFLRQVRRAGQAADQPAFLVGHEQQRVVPQRVVRAGVGLVQFGDDPGELRRAGDVAAEEDHPGDLAGPDPAQQAGGRGEPVVAVDHPLAGQLRGRERRQG